METKKIMTEAIKGHINNYITRHKEDDCCDLNYFFLVNRACNFTNFDFELLRKELQRYNIFSDEDFLNSTELPAYFEQ